MFSAINLSLKFQCFIKVLVLYSLILTLVPPICQFYSPTVAAFSFRGITVSWETSMFGTPSSSSEFIPPRCLLPWATSSGPHASSTPWQRMTCLVGGSVFFVFCFFLQGTQNLDWNHCSIFFLIALLTFQSLKYARNTDVICYMKMPLTTEKTLVSVSWQCWLPDNQLYLQLQRDKHSLKILRWCHLILTAKFILLIIIAARR